MLIKKRSQIADFPHTLDYGISMPAGINMPGGTFGKTNRRASWKITP